MPDTKAPNGWIAPGIYVVRFPDERYTQLRRACWYAWAREVAGDALHVELVTRRWGPPEPTGSQAVDDVLLRQAQARQQGIPPRPNKVGLDRDEYQGFAVWDAVPYWDFRGDCAFAAWPWDGKQDLELAATGQIAEPYSEIDAAKAAGKAVIRKGAEVAIAVPEALGNAANRIASVTPWWIKAGLGVLAIGALGYAARSVK